MTLGQRLGKDHDHVSNMFDLGMSRARCLACDDMNVVVVFVVVDDNDDGDDNRG